MTPGSAAGRSAALPAIDQSAKPQTKSCKLNWARIITSYPSTSMERIVIFSVDESRQHLGSHQIERSRAVARRAHPKISKSHARQRADPLHNIVGRAGNGETVEKIFRQPQLLDELGVLAGLHSVLRIVVFLMKTPDVVFETLRNIFSGEP